MAVMFKELCLDVGDRDSGVAAFWAQSAGLTWHPGASSGPGFDPGDLLGTEEGMGIALCPVPEPKSVKNRVHLDVSVSDLAELLDRGATVLDDSQRWTVMADPAGNEFCAFVRDGELPAHRVFEVVVDSVDPESMARWWADAFGVEAHNDGKPWWWIEGAPGFPASGPWWGMVFNPVPEPKTVKNRLHWDLYGDPVDLLDAGATLRWEVAGGPALLRGRCWRTQRAMSSAFFRRGMRRRGGAERHRLGPNRRSRGRIPAVWTQSVCLRARRPPPTLARTTSTTARSPTAWPSGRRPRGRPGW